MAPPEQVTQLITLMQQQITQQLTNPQQGNMRVGRGRLESKKKRDGPIINTGIDEREWTLFTDTWSQYKSVIGISSDVVGNADAVRTELRLRCSNEVNKLLFEFVGAENLNTCTEDELLAHIKSVAVKVTQQEVHRMSFGMMTQHQGETINAYVIRLKAKASLCKFEVTCPSCDPETKISYAEDMVAQRLIAGLSNLDQQRKVLSGAAVAATLMTKHTPSQRIILAIRDFPTPTSGTDIRSWFGLVNQVAYTFAQSLIMEPFRDYVESEGEAFKWDETMDDLFKISKGEIIRLVEEGVRTYDLKRSTCLATNWSKKGVGFSLTQKHCKCCDPANPECGVGHWKLVFAGSRFTTDAQQRYAPIEGECLAAVYGLERCRMFTLGCPDLILAVDHKPLTKLLDDRKLDSIANPRLLKLKEKTLPYDFKIVYVPGGSNAMKTAEAASQHPVADKTRDTADDGVEDVTRAFAIQQVEGVESMTWCKVDEAATVDEECMSLVRQIIDGFPDEESSLPPILQKYWGMRDHLYVIDNVPFKGKKMLIPSTLRPQVLEGLYAANQDISGMLSNSQKRFFWPGLDTAVRQMRLQDIRLACEEAHSQTAEPPVVAPSPEVPFEQTVADMFSLQGHTFLVFADRFSGWIEVERLPSYTFRYVEQAFLKWFTTYVVPEEIATDGGPPFNSFDYSVFLRTWDVRKRLSSAYSPQSNGRAEAAVESIKRTLLGNIDHTTGMLDTDAAARAIMTHRNTPTQDTDIPPSVMLFGRPLRDHLPRYDRKLRPEWETIAKSRERALAKRSPQRTTSEGTELGPLIIGDCVQVHNQTGHYPNKWHNTGIVAGVLPNRQYRVIIDGSRRVVLQNRRLLREIFPVSREEFDLNPVVSEPNGCQWLPIPNVPLDPVTVENPPPLPLDEDAQDTEA